MTPDSFTREQAVEMCEQASREAVNTFVTRINNPSLDLPTIADIAAKVVGERLPEPTPAPSVEWKDEGSPRHVEFVNGRFVLTTNGGPYHYESVALLVYNWLVDDDTLRDLLALRDGAAEPCKWMNVYNSDAFAVYNTEASAKEAASKTSYIKETAVPLYRTPRAAPVVVTDEMCERAARTTLVTPWDELTTGTQDAARKQMRAALRAALQQGEGE